jgi:hypothetical protein
MAEISGVEGFVLAGGVEIEATDWSFDGEAAIVDRTSFMTRGKPKNAAGQENGSVTINGVNSTTTALAAKGVRKGVLITFRLGVTANLFIDIVVRVGRLSHNQNKDNGSGWTINGQQYGDVTIVL